MHDVKGRWMNGVSPKVTKKIVMFLKNHNLNAHACQEKTQHHAGGAPAGNAATRVDHSVQANLIMALDAPNVPIWDSAGKVRADLLGHRLRQQPTFLATILIRYAGQ
jgi:hypothetical protein